MINKVILVGRLGKDPEVRYVEENVPIAKFPLATTERYTTKEGKKGENTEWHDIVMWRGLAKVAESYLKKGSLVYIEGKLKKRSYEDKEGVKKFRIEILADNMQMLEPRRKEETISPVVEEPESSVDDRDETLPNPQEKNDLPF